MKKHTASLMTAAMLLTVAWLTGCDSKELEQPAGTGTAPALETIAEPVTEAATEAIEATEAAGQSFDDYAAFAAAMAEQHPGKTPGPCHTRRRKACWQRGRGKRFS